MNTHPMRNATAALVVAIIVIAAGGGGAAASIATQASESTTLATIADRNSKFWSDSADEKGRAAPISGAAQRSA